MTENPEVLKLDKPYNHPVGSLMAIATAELESAGLLWGLRSIESGTRPDNHAMQAVCERQGRKVDSIGYRFDLS